MKIGSINPYSVYSNRQNPTFNGYYEVMREGAKTSVKNLEHAQRLFGDLMTEIDQDVQMTKTPFFNVIKTIFDKKGLKGLFGILTKPADQYAHTEGLLLKVKEDNVVPIVVNRGHVLDITSFSDKPHDIHLGFSAGIRKGFIEFSSDKKGNIFVERGYGDNYNYTGFYADTGTKKVEVESYAGGLLERTYYNKDGSKPFFKNWFLGGVAVEPIY